MLICEIQQREIIFQGEKVGVCAIRDITERVESERQAKEKEQQLIQADKMVSLGVLVSGMAHEINNPNSFMTLNLPLLEEIWRDITPILEDYYHENGDFLAGGWSTMNCVILCPTCWRGCRKVPAGSAES